MAQDGAIDMDPAPAEGGPEVAAAETTVPLEPRFGHTVTAVGDQVVVWGGSSDEGADGAILDTKTMEWTGTPKSPLGPRHSHHAIALEDRLLVMGGVHDGELLSDAAWFEPATQTWEIAAFAAPVALSTNDSQLVSDAGTLILWSSSRSELYVLEKGTLDWDRYNAPSSTEIEASIHSAQSSAYLVSREIGDVGGVPAHTLSIHSLDFASLDASWVFHGEITFSEGRVDPSATLAAIYEDHIVVWQRSMTDGETAFISLDGSAFFTTAGPPLEGCEADPRPIQTPEVVIISSPCGGAATLTPSLEWLALDVPAHLDANTTASVSGQLIGWEIVCCFGSLGPPQEMAFVMLDLPG